MPGPFTRLRSVIDEVVLRSIRWRIVKVRIASERLRPSVMA